MRRFYPECVNYEIGGIDNFRVTFQSKEHTPEGFSKAPFDSQFLKYFLSHRARAEEIVPQLAALANRKIPLQEVNDIILPNFLDRQEELVYSAYMLCLLAENYKMIHGRPSITGYRVKMIAYYQVMFENITPNDASSYSKGKNGRELIKEYNNLRDKYSG